MLQELEREKLTFGQWFWICSIGQENIADKSCSYLLVWSEEIFKQSQEMEGAYVKRDYSVYSQGFSTNVSSTQCKQQ